MAQLPPSSFARFYKDIARYPEVGGFHRFEDLWSKKLYDDTKDVIAGIQGVDNALAASLAASGKSVKMDGCAVLNFPRSVVYEDYEAHSGVRQSYDEYEKALKKYGETLCLCKQIFNLPDQPSYAAKRLKEHRVFFGVGGTGIFGPTGEEGSAYQGASDASDICCLPDPEPDDFFTTWMLNHAGWIGAHVPGPFRKLFFGQHTTLPGQPLSLHYERIVAMMDIVTCIFTPVLLTSVLFILTNKNLSPRLRIGIIGILGTVFSLALKFTAGHPTRAEVFAATGAFFAVAVVFVSNSGNGSPVQ